jgi:hypothetical protein
MIHPTSPPPESTPRRRRRGWAVWLGLAAILALVPRVWNISGSYDHLDEEQVVCVNQRLWNQSGWDTDWAKTDMHPAFRDFHYQFVSYHYAAHFFTRIVRPLVPAETFAARRQLIVLRVFSALCGAAGVVFVLLLGRHIAGWTGAAGASFLYALNPALVQDAHYARPDAFMTCLALAVAWLCLAASGRKRLRLGTASALVGLLVASKVTCGLLAVLPAWLVLRAGWRDGWKTAAPLVALAPAGFLVGVVLGMPFAIAHFNLYLSDMTLQLAIYGGSHPPHNLVSGGALWPLLRDYFLAVHGGLLFALAVGGGLWFAWHRRWDELVMLLLPAAFCIFYFARQRVFFERNLCFVLPFLFVAAAAAAVALGRVLAPRTGSPWVAGALALLLAAMAALPGARMTDRLVRGALDDREITQERIRQEQALAPVAAGLREWYTFGTSDPVPKLLARFGRSEQPPVLIGFNDYNDDYFRQGWPELRSRLIGEEVYLQRGPFWDLPVCTLNVYHGAKVHFLLVTGVRSPEF